MTDTIDIEWNDQQWKIPASGDDWPYEAVEAMEQGRVMTFVRHILGPDQMRAFLAGKPTAGHAGELMMKVIDAAGGKTAGE